jgi:hypothetical protein
MPEPDLFVSLQSSLGCGTLEWLALALADVLMLLAGTQKPSTAGGKSFFFRVQGPTGGKSLCTICRVVPALALSLGWLGAQIKLKSSESNE